MPQGTYQSENFYTSVTHSAHVDPKNPKQTEFMTDFKLKGGLKTEEERQKYRETWTQEDESNKVRRFRTTMNGVCLSKEGGLDRTMMVTKSTLPA